MKSLKYIATFTAMALNSALAAVTDPVGFVTVSVPPNSDAVLAVPLNRAATFKGMIQTISGNTITVAGTPAWATTPAQFVQALPGQVETYAVQLASGTKEGMIAKIVSNTSNSVTIQLDAGDDLTGVVAEDADAIANNGDQIDIFPYWTPGSLLGTTLPAATEFLGFEGVGAGVNKAATAVYGATGSSWEDGDTGDDVTYNPLQFGRAFILRNNGASVINISMVGSVPMSAFRIRLSTLGANQDQDLRIGYISPIPETVASLNIPAQAGDIIFGFNNSASGKNKSASTTYAFDGSQWVNDETGDPLTAADKLQPGFGYVFRKFRTATPTSVVWQKLPSYLQ